MRPVRPAAYWSRTGFLRIRAVFRADAAICHSFSWDRELWAVAALRLAGFSAGRRGSRRAGGASSARRGGSRAGLCSSCAGRAILSECRVFVRAHHAFLSECRAFVRAHHAFLSECPAFDHACCLPHERQTERLAGCSVPVPPWVVIAGSAFSNRRCGYRAFLVHFGRARFLWRRSRRRTKETRRTGGTRRTESAARCKCAFA